MIELTEQQTAAVAAVVTGPPFFVDPRTGERYVLLRHREFAELVAADRDYDDSGVWTEEERAAAYWAAIRAAGWDEDEWSMYDDPKYDTPEGG
jgi:hypothetical protein